MRAKGLYSENSLDRIKLPKPDLKNITVLTRNLPNSPILPWNHYDSPRLQAECSDKARENQDQQESKDQQENKNQQESKD